MPQPVLTTAEVKAMVMEQLNVSKVAYGTFDGSPLWKDDFIDDCIFQGDIDVVKCISRAPGHPRRDEYGLDLSVINTPGVRVLLSGSNHHFGEPVSVYITRNDDLVVEGKTAPAQKITEWLLDKASYGGDDCVDGYYSCKDSHFIFSGKTALVRVLQVAPHTLSDTGLYAPFENKITVYRLAMAELLKKDPGRKQDAADFRTDADKDLAMIMGVDAKMTPSIEAYNQSR